MRSLWAAGMLLRRLRDERGIVLLTAGLVAATSFLFAAAPRLFNRVSDDALRFAAVSAPATQRNVALAVTTAIPPGNAGGVEAVAARGARLEATFPEPVRELISERAMRLTTVRFLVTDPPSYETHVSLRYQDGMADLTRLVAGRWPLDRGVPILPPSFEDVDEDGLPDGPPAETVTFEVAFSAASAAEVGLELGDSLVVTLDRSDPSVRGQGYAIGPMAIEIVGLYEPLDPNAEPWAGDSGLLEVAQVGTDDNPIAYATAWIPAAMYPNLASSELPFHYEWRFTIDPDRLDAGRVDPLRTAVRRLGRAGTGTQPGLDGTVAVLTGLGRILDRYVTERALSESVLSVAAVGPFGLAGGAIAMVAILLVRRRTGTLALARGRGASGALVLGTQLWEGILVAGGAALVGLLVAVTLVAARASPLSPVLAVAVGAVALALLVGASWAVARRPLGRVERDDPPVFRVSPRRLVIELTIVGIAVAASLLLRQRGLQIGEADENVRFDPLLAAVPVLSGLAAGILVLRLYPLPIRVLGWLAARRRDVVPVLGLRTIGRHPAAANLPLLVLLLTAAFGAFASVVASSLARAQLQASYLAVGADYRLERVGIGALAPTLDPATIPGVEAVAGGVIETAAHFSSTANQRASIYTLAVDAPAYEAIVGGTPVAPGWPSAFLATPTGTGIGTEERPIPAIVSQRLPLGSADLATGDLFNLAVEGEDLVFRVVDRRASVPGLAERPIFTIVPLNWIEAANGQRLARSVLWVRAPESVAEPLGAAVVAAPGLTRVSSRYEALASLTDDPLSAAIGVGYWLAVVVAAGYMALTIVGAMVLSAERRTRDLAFLRALGFTTPQALGLTVTEHAPPVVLALVPGVALGIGVAALCLPGLGLATFIGAADEVPMHVDWAALAGFAAALIAVVAVAVVAGSWLSGRARLVDALRYGDN